MITKDNIKVGAKFIQQVASILITVTKIRNDDRVTVEVTNILGFNKNIVYYSNPSALAERLNNFNYKLMNPEPKSEIIEIEHKGRKIKFNLTAAEKAGIVEIEPEIRIYDGVKYKDLFGNHFSFSVYGDDWFKLKGGKIINCIGNRCALEKYIKDGAYILVKE